MPVLKFWKKEEIVLDTYRMENITKDDRTSKLNMASFMLDKYIIDKDVFMVINDFFFSMAKILNKGPEIHAMLIEKDGKNIIVIPSKSYVFWNGKSIEPLKYELKQEEMRNAKLV